MLRQLAAAVADGDETDWSEVDRRLAGTPEAGMAARLRLVHAVRQEELSRSVVTSAVRPAPAKGGTALAGAMGILLALAAFQVGGAVAGMLGTLHGGAPPSAVPAVPGFLAAVAFGGAGMVLARAGRRDRRALCLAGFFLCTASSSSLRFLNLAATVLPFFPARWLAALLPEPFLPFFLWMFAQEFPRVVRLDRWAGLVRGAVRASALVGVVLFTVNAARSLLPAVTAHAAGLWELLARRPTGLYWLVLSALCLPVPAVAWARSRLAGDQERRRVRFFLFGLGAGVLPLVTGVLAEALFPSLFRFMNRPRVHAAATVFYFALLLTVPVSTAYAVLAHRLLDVRLVARRAARIVLARRSLLFLGILPSLLLLGHLLRQRARPLGLILAEAPGPALLLAAALGWTLIASRRRVDQRLGSRLAGRTHEPELVLAAFGSDAREAHTAGELAGAVRGRLAELVAAEHVRLLLYDAATRSYRPAERGLRCLPAGSRFAELVAASPVPLSLAEEGRDSFLPWLVEEDRQWIADADAQLAVGVPGPQGRASALLLLGATTRGLRYERQQKQALTAFAATAALAIERLAGFASPAVPSAEAEDRPAGECRGCGRARLRVEGSCGCGGSLTPAAIPFELAGKFRLERVLGRGGMGVVYLATDLTLARKVALKTLPQLRTDALFRLRKEARSMAGFVHPNLALIFGLETWRGVPVLVVEYLAGGTLAVRLGTGLAPADVLRLGQDLAAAIETMHGKGLLHRDIKPSNVGLTTDGVPKLLDFGLAHLVAETRVELLAADEAALAPADSPFHSTSTGQVVGTPLYLPPEALAGADPSPLTDLWSLHLLLWEAAAGRHPCAGMASAAALRRIARGELPDIRSVRPDCPASLAELLLRGLHPNPRRRLPSARAVREAIRDAALALS